MTGRSPIYLDNQSTTPLDPRVLESMMPYLTSEFGNAASKTHAFGWRAEEAVNLARRQVAQFIGASEKEIVFTSGATEANNIAIKGLTEAYRDKGNHVVTTTIEHKSVLDTCKHLEQQFEHFAIQLAAVHLSQVAAGQVAAREEVQEQPPQCQCDVAPTLDHSPSRPGFGARVTYVGVDHNGCVVPARIEEALADSTVLVSVMLANNEIGTIQPVKRIAEMCHAKGVLFHCDAAQGLGKIPFDVSEMQVDLASLSAHKIYGPKGVGALYVRNKPRVRLAPLIDGGGHERGMRSGTLNVPGIVGFGKACEIAHAEMGREADRVLRLREQLREVLWTNLDGLSVNGSLEHRLPGNLNVTFADVEAEALMMGLKDVALSSGSACTSASLEPSYVLRACGVDDESAHSSIRFGIGRFNTDEEIVYVADVVVDRVNALRRLRETTR